MAEYKEMKKNLILTLITLLASSGGSAVWRDGMFPQFAFELYNWEKDYHDHITLASKVQSLRIIKNKNKGKLKDNIELYINIVINHRRPIVFGSFFVDQ